MSGRQVLVVEDEVPYRELLERQLARRGYAVTAVGSAEEALELPAEHEVAICDISLPGMSGIELLRRLRERAPLTQTIVLTGQGSVATAIEAMKLGAYHYFEKPVKLQELALYVEGALEKRRLAAENRHLRDQLARHNRPPAYVGDSEPVRRVRELMGRVARAAAPVLIEGETGTGKDLVARGIHQLSERHEQAFVAINCGALAESLLENELFGHVAGAFTGAAGEQRGLFEVAHGGTLFIDEVAEMSLEIQKKFLRVLENGEIMRLGEARVRVVDVRVVAATNRELKPLVAQGRFREDLYYRLAVLSVRTPPLREHLDDLPLLIDELLARGRARQGRKLTVEPALLARMRGYSWPGNVRELRNVLERAAVLAPGDTLRLEDCPGLFEEPALRAGPLPPLAPAAPPAAAPPLAPAGAEAAAGTLEDVERGHILRVLQACDGNKTEAARRLGVSLRTLYRRLEKLGLK